INAANAGITAAAVQVAPSTYKLQLTSSSTGVANSMTIDTGAFSSQLGALGTITAAVDAKITVAKGSANQYSVTSASNTLTGVLPGVTLTLLKADPNTPVTVSVANDGSALADNVQKLVDSINDALKYINSQTTYDADKKVA